MVKLFVTLLLVLVSFTSLLAQNTTPCSSEAHRQFDFWLGEWDVYNTTADTIVGHNHIKSILNGCVLEENWTGGSGFTGKSFNTYNPVDSTWNQVWVDVAGSAYHFSGKYTDGLISLAGTSKTKRGEVWFTLTFTHDKEQDTVRQVWNMSTDKGENWSLLFDGTYRRKK